MRMILGAVALLAVCNAAQASPITYTLTGDLTGTLTSAGSSITFTNTAFLWQVVSDTNSITSIPGPPPGPAIPAITDTITIGATVLSPNHPDILCLGLRARLSAIRHRWLRGRHHAPGPGLEFDCPVWLQRRHQFRTAFRQFRGLQAHCRPTGAPWTFAPPPRWFSPLSMSRLRSLCSWSDWARSASWQ